MTKTVLVSGNFNILHPGHLRLLRFARDLGDRLLVCVQSDRLAGEYAHIPEQLRLEGVVSNSFVTEAFLIDEPIEEVIGRLRPEVVVKGKEHEHRANRELGALSEYGGQLVFCSGDAVFSSLDLMRLDLLGSTQRITSTPNDYLTRHAIVPNEIVDRIDAFGKLRVCVIGDLIVDEYIACEPLGMSQEDPTIVVTPIDTSRFIGGAGIVAAHAAGLGAEVHFLTVAGYDDCRDYAVGELARGGVTAEVFDDNTRPTTLKQRFRASEKTLLRVNHVHQASIDLSFQAQILEHFQELAGHCQLLVFSDYNYGCLPQSLVDQIVGCARGTEMVMVADSQSSSQIGDVSRFKGMDLLTPTEHEARVSLRNQQDGLVVLAENLRAASDAKNVILKLGAEGALLHMEGGEGSPHTDRIPALNAVPRDVVGAGDSLLISGAMALAAGATPWEAAYIGAVASAVQVSRTGNLPLAQSELIAEII